MSLPSDAPDLQQAPGITPEVVIRSLYLTFLGRAPDGDGLDYWSGVLSDGLAHRDAAELLQDVTAGFVATPEAQRKLIASLAANPDASAEIRAGEVIRAAVREEFLLPGLQPKLRDVIGLGSNCYPASLLSRFGARSASGPFDWVFSTPAMVRDCLDDDFAAFLDSSHYRFVPIEERDDPDFNRVSHTLFEQRYAIAAPVFNHTDAHLPAGQAYLQRCVARFRAALAGTTPTRFLLIGQSKPTASDAFRQTLATLRKYCPQPRLVQVSVLPGPGPGTEPCCATLDTDPAGRLFSFQAASPWRATRFDDLLDDLLLMRAIEAAFAAIG